MPAVASAAKAEPLAPNLPLHRDPYYGGKWQQPKSERYVESISRGSRRWDYSISSSASCCRVLELGVEAAGECIHRTAVGVVGGVGDELVIEADAHAGC
jgi:hypothetical protein